MVLCVASNEEQDITTVFRRRHQAGLGIMQEYVRQVLLEKIIRESEQAALREQAASLLAASQPVAARPGPGGFLGIGRFGVPEQPASGMKAFHQQHLQNQMLQVLLQHPHCSLQYACRMSSASEFLSQTKVLLEGHPIVSHAKVTSCHCRVFQATSVGGEPVWI